MKGLSDLSTKYKVMNDYKNLTLRIRVKSTDCLRYNLATSLGDPVRPSDSASSMCAAASG